MASDDEYEAALAQLARAEGKSVEQLKKELLREHLKEHLVAKSASATPAKPATPAFDGDASRSGMSQHARLAERRGTAPDRYRGETSEEAKERWYEEEASLIDGVHGLGGSSGGGIFGDGPIATSEYDPAAEMRAESRAAGAVQLRTLRVLEQVAERLPGLVVPRALPGRRRTRQLK